MPEVAPSWTEKNPILHSCPLNVERLVVVVRARQRYRGDHYAVFGVGSRRDLGIGGSVAIWQLGGVDGIVIRCGEQAGETGG